MENGFKINEMKTKLVHFHNKRRPQPNIKISIGNQSVGQVTTHKFLGVHFDTKLTWKTHIRELLQKTTPSLNLTASCQIQPVVKQK